MENENYFWGPALKKEDMESVTSNILTLGKELNDARLTGFITQVITRHYAAAIVPAHPSSLKFP